MLLFTLLSEGAVLDLDATVVIQLAIFLIAFFVLRALVFRPMTRLLEAREQAIGGAREDARKVEKQALEKAVAFDEELRKVKLSAGDERDRLREEGTRLERVILERTRQETQASLAGAEASISAHGKVIRAEMATTIPALAKEIAGKLLGREVR